MTPFEALYDQACRSLVLWDEVDKHQLLGPKCIQKDVEMVNIIRQRLLTAQSRQKSYVDKRSRELEFSEGDLVFLHISPIKGVNRFGVKGKLAPRFIKSFQILKRVSPVAYKLALPPSLAGVHNVFHVSMLQKYVSNPSHVLESLIAPLYPDATYENHPVRILEHKEHQLQKKKVRLVKVAW
ncbi:uncharacterized protein LOC141837590 [Curcuma longa]|uniref:uncharacterized protein LOC141837590 n=1 Tax=Curcuma longa TaxID=136217 RepID=UPI003D9F6656